MPARIPRTYFSCWRVSIAPGRTARTCLIAVAGCDTEFDQKSSPDHTGASKPAAAMNQDIASVAQQRAKLVTGSVPLPLEFRRRRRDIDDRQVEPRHPSATHLLPKVFHPKHDQFLRLHQSNDGGGSPIADRIEIERQITIPRPAHGMRVILAWAERDANPSEGGPCGYGRDLQWMRQGCPFHSASRLSAGTSATSGSYTTGRCTERTLSRSRRYRAGYHASIFSAARNADCGISTLPNWRMRFLPSFCFSSSLRLRVMSPP